MNRLIIVGNGFDLAHGLATSYCDFINDFWKNLKRNHQDNAIKKVVFVNSQFSQIFGDGSINSFKDFEKNLKEYCQYYKYSYNSHGNYASYADTSIFKFENNFFRTITKKQHIQNWVDIENEYYKLLIKCLEEGNNDKVNLLNTEFDQVKSLLEDYLSRKITDRYDFGLPNENIDKILKLLMIEPLGLRQNTSHSFLKEFSKQDHNELMEFDDMLIESSNDGSLHIDLAQGKICQKNLILNFNYTPIIDTYVRSTVNTTRLRRTSGFGETSQIQIHGRLRDPNNPINFGFGDEMDDNYKLLERKDDNEYLKNIKSFQYLQNCNYKEMLDFIDNAKFQVYVFGHSCGLSDRILLNKIFEHINCRSIKVFYHEFDKPKSDGRIDNYTEIIQNISRHFNKKEMMREKIVNKSLCQPLPQTVRFDEKGSYSSYIRENWGV